MVLVIFIVPESDEIKFKVSRYDLPSRKKLVFNYESEVVQRSLENHRLIVASVSPLIHIYRKTCRLGREFLSVLPWGGDGDGNCTT
jgi:hypothetical protein